jgi:hypothetical protein
MGVIPVPMRSHIWPVVHLLLLLDDPQPPVGIIVVEHYSLVYYERVLIRLPFSPSTIRYRRGCAHGPSRSSNSQCWTLANGKVPF